MKNTKPVQDVKMSGVSVIHHLVHLCVFLNGRINLSTTLDNQLAVKPLIEYQLNIDILLHLLGQRPQSLYLKDIFHITHTSLQVIAVSTCHNSLLWFIERVELLTSDPIQTQQYFLMHLEQAPYMPAQRLNFHLDQKYLTPIWKGKGNGKLYI